MTRTILLADDSVTIQKVVELTFLDEDFRVVAFGDGSEAIAALEEVRPSVVIADVHMPGADGYEVAEAVGRALPGTPVLLLVGTFEVFDAERASATGAAGHLKKPFDSQELLRRVQELSAGGASQAAPPAVAWSAAPEPAAVEPVFEAAPAPESPEALAWEPEPARFEPEPSTVTAPELSWSTAASVPEPAPVAMAQPAAAAMPLDGLSDADLEKVARRVAELVGDRILREVAWEVVPDLAEVLLKARIRELEASVE